MTNRYHTENISLNLSISKDIEWHLKRCNEHFVPKLSSYVDIRTYAKKLELNAERFELWTEDKKLAGLLAAYFSKESDSIFITNLSVLPEYYGKNIAKILMMTLIREAREQQYSEVLLEVFRNNLRAVNFYVKMGFNPQTPEKNKKLIYQLKLKQ